MLNHFFLFFCICIYLSICAHLVEAEYLYQVWLLNL